MGVCEVAELIRKQGGKMSIEELKKQNVHGPASTMNAIRKLVKKRREALIYFDTDGTKMVYMPRVSS